MLASLGSVLAMAVRVWAEPQTVCHHAVLRIISHTAIGMGVSEELGGYVTITVAVIIITGVTWKHVGRIYLQNVPYP